MSFGDDNKDIYKEKCLKIKTNIWSLLHQNNTNEIIIVWIIGIHVAILIPVCGRTHF